MKYLTKAAILLLLAAVALPWPAVVIVRGLAAGLIGLQHIFWKLTDSKDSGVKSAGFFLATLNCLLGIWPIGLALYFLTVWYDRLALALVVLALTLEDTRRPESVPQPDPPEATPRDERGKVYRMHERAEPQGSLTAPQARACALQQFKWDPSEYDCRWDFHRQLWRDPDGYYLTMDGSAARAA